MRASATLAAALVLAFAVHAATAVGQRREVPPRVALTFDDMPVHSVLPLGFTRTQIATRIIEALRARRSPPVYGFINAKALTDSLIRPAR